MSRYRIQAKSNKRSELLIYGDIGDQWWDEESNDAKSIVSQLSEMPDTGIDVRINSYGGIVADGLAIYNALKRKDDVDVYIDGVAFSIASLIAMGGKRVFIAENGMVMIHAPWGFAAGNAEDMRDMADTLDKFADAMVSSYVREGGPDKEIIAGWLKDGEDHIFTSVEALDLGIVDHVSDAIDIAAAFRSFPKQIQIAAGAAKEQVKKMAGNDDRATESSPVEPIMSAYGQAEETGRSEGVKAEKRRQSEIRALMTRRSFQAGPVQAVLAACLEDERVSKPDALERALQAAESLPENAPINTISEMPQSGAPYADAAPRVTGGADRSQEGISAALMIRSGLTADRETIAKERSNEFLAMSLVEMMGRELRSAGHRVGGTREHVAKAFVRHSTIQAAGPSTGTGHLTGILVDVANKAVMQGWDQADESWREWTMSGTLNDYRAAQRANLALTSKLNQMQENEQWEYGKLRDVKQSITGYFYGIKDALSIQAIVNDDLNELTRGLAARGEAASATVGDAVFTLLTASGTGGFGQTMDEDSQIVFHADHSNYVASGSGGAPAAATISAGLVAMGTQTDQNSRTIGVRPRYILHGQTLVPTVAPLLSSATLITGADGTLPSGNWVSGLGLEPVIDYRWDGWTTASAWVLTAARRTVEVSGVAGPLTPNTEQAMVSDIPGITYETSMPFGCAVLDYRGLYFNYGS